MTDHTSYYIDFDKLFENFADKYYKEHEAEYDSPDDFARDLDKVYHIWATSPQDVIGGLSPSAFFNRIPTEDLIDILKGACVGERNPSSLLFDRIATEPSLLGGLIKLARSTADEKLLTVVLSLINEIGDAPSEFYIDTIERNDICSDVKDFCLETLVDRADEIKDTLLEHAEKADDVGIMEMFAEPLTYCATGDARIVELLKKLLHLDPNVAYIAGLIGRYGDESLASELYALLDTCDYAEFLEIRNAIEELGGTVDEHYRDFTDDPMYLALKTLKSKK